MQFCFNCPDCLVVLHSIVNYRRADLLQFFIMFFNGRLQLCEFITERNNFLTDKSSCLTSLFNFNRFKIRCSESRQITGVLVTCSWSSEPVNDGNNASELNVQPLITIIEIEAKDNLIAIFFINVPFKNLLYNFFLFYTFILCCKGIFIKNKC